MAIFIWHAFHSCVFRNTLHEWAFHTRYSISFFPDFVFMAAPKVSGLANTSLVTGGNSQGAPTHHREVLSPTQSRDTINREAHPIQRLQWGKVLHATSQVVSQGDNLKGRPWMDEDNEKMKPTLASQSMVE